jgi:hypothetical protein
MALLHVKYGREHGLQQTRVGRMVSVRRVVLDVLKPHQPNALEFSRAIAKVGDGYRVCLTVVEMDDKTETLQLEIEADSVDMQAIESAISSMGASLHSIDQVEVLNHAGDV